MGLERLCHCFGSQMGIQILEEFLDTWKEEELKKQLIESKRYLKADFKVIALLHNATYMNQTKCVRNKNIKSSIR